MTERDPPDDVPLHPGRDGSNLPTDRGIEFVRLDERMQQRHVGRHAGGGVRDRRLPKVLETGWQVSSNDDGR